MGQALLLGPLSQSTGISKFPTSFNTTSLAPHRKRADLLGTRDGDEELAGLDARIGAVDNAVFGQLVSSDDVPLGLRSRHGGARFGSGASGEDDDGSVMDTDLQRLAVEACACAVIIFRKTTAHYHRRRNRCIK